MLALRSVVVVRNASTLARRQSSLSCSALRCRTAVGCASFADLTTKLRSRPSTFNDIRAFATERPWTPSSQSARQQSSLPQQELPRPSSAIPSPTFASRLWPYAELARIDKPTGTLLLYLPCTWSLTLAAHANHLPPSLLAWNVFLFGTGAFIMRGAGCTINDMWDRKLDANVARTSQRPLASGQVTPFQALVFTGVQLSAGLAVLLQLNAYSIGLGAASLALVVVYPFMKRITYWPQFVLGLAFNWGALLGWSAMIGSLQGALPVLLPLYAGSIFWTLIYDTIYAHQDKVDDVTAGIKSTALLFGEHTRSVLSVFSVGMLGLIGTGVSRMDAAHPYLLNTAAQTWTELATTGHPFFTAALSLSAAHLAWQIWTVRLDDRADCWSKFRSNCLLGAMLWAGLLLDYGIQINPNDEVEEGATAKIV